MNKNQNMIPEETIGEALQLEQGFGGGVPVMVKPHKLRTTYATSVADCSLTLHCKNPWFSLENLEAPSTALSIKAMQPKGSTVPICTTCIMIWGSIVSPRTVPRTLWEESLHWVRDKRLVSGCGSIGSGLLIPSHGPRP